MDRHPLNTNSTAKNPGRKGSPGGPKRPGKKAALAAWLEREHPREIGEAEWTALRGHLEPVSENYLRHLLRDCGVPLAPLVEGVRQESLDALEASLLRLWREYEGAGAPRRQAIRRIVITAKDRARWASRREDRQAEKSEMILWMTTWLENPPLFPAWVRLRRAAIV